MKINKVMVIILLIANLGLIGLSTLQWMRKEKKVGYIDLIKVFNEFDYKKQLQQQLEQVATKRQNIMDSLKFEIQMLERKVQADQKIIETNPQNPLKLAREKYRLYADEFSQEHDRLAGAYDDKIFKQLNQYVRDYGSEHGYELIFGADGTGVLMYGDESQDITEKIIPYINKRFKGEAR